MDMKPPEIRTLSVAPAAHDYVTELQRLGLLEGDPGHRSLHGGVTEVMNALHHLVAGGNVSVQVVEEGSASVVEDLDAMFLDALRETNELYGKNGRLDF